MPSQDDNLPETFQRPTQADGFEAADTPIIISKVQGESYPRAVMKADGSIVVGDGTAYPTDTVSLGAGVVVTADLADLAVSTGKIADEAVTVGKMADLTQESILVGGASDRPTALAITASRILGRKATGSVAALTAAEVLALLHTPSTFVVDPTGGATTDAEARTAIVAILDILIAQGLMAAS